VGQGESLILAEKPAIVDGADHGVDHSTIVPIDGDLGAIVAAWPTLDQRIKRAVLVLIGIDDSVDRF
jgi:hypothetical protein